MNSDPDDIEQLVEELRADLPSARDAARVKARLAGLGLAVGAGFSSATAAASVGAKASAELGAVGFWSQVSAWSWGAKLGLATAVSLPAVTAPLWVPAVTAPTAGVTASSGVRTVEARRKPAERALRVPAAAPALGVFDGSSVSEPSAAPSVQREAVAGDADAGLRPGRDAEASGERSRQSKSAIADSRLRDSRLPAHSSAEPGLVAQAEPAEAQVGAPGITGITGITGVLGTGASAVTAPAAPAEGTTSAPNASSAPTSQPATPGPTPATAALSTLGEETALMDAALSALRAGELASAARYLQAHEQRFPNGLLRRERERARRTLLERGRTRD
jgi:hypothetical protein